MFAVHVKAHTEVVLRLIDVEVPGVLRRDDKCAIFRNDGEIIVDERRWGIALWSEVDERRWGIALWSEAWAGSLMRSDVDVLAMSGRRILFDVRRFPDCRSGFFFGTSLLTSLRSTMKV